MCKKRLQVCHSSANWMQTPSQFDLTVVYPVCVVCHIKRVCKTSAQVLFLRSPARSLYEAIEVFQGHSGPGQRPLQVHTQDVDNQQGADGQHAEHQPLLERHPRQGVCEQQAACARAALRSAWRNMRRQRMEAGEDAVLLRTVWFWSTRGREAGGQWLRGFN